MVANEPMLPGGARAVHNGSRPAEKRPRLPARPVNIIILDDYQDAVRKLKCAAILEQLNAKVFTNTVKGIGQLSVRLRDADVLVLIRERTQLPAPAAREAAQARS